MTKFFFYLVIYYFYRFWINLLLTRLNFFYGFFILHIYFTDLGRRNNEEELKISVNTDYVALLEMRWLYNERFAAHYLELLDDITRC